MKRILALVLVCVMVFALFGCTGQQSGGETAATTENLSGTGEGFRVGFGRAIITPEENLPLGGFGTSATRIMKDVLDDTYVTCIALSDEADNTVLLMPVDLQRIEDAFIALLRKSVNAATGIPEDRIIITCSHTHSIPDLLYDTHEGIQRYKNLLMERFAKAAKDALADRMPAQIYTGRIDAEGLNFVKHYQFMDEEGNLQHFGDNFGTATYNDSTQHVKEPYDDILLLKFTREGGKDIVVSNFRSHPTLTGGTKVYDLSSDFVGPYREAVEAQMNCHFAFVQGACGNINPRSRIASENFGTEKNHREYGAKLAQVTIEGLQNNMTLAESGAVQSKVWKYTANVDHSQDSLVGAAILVQQKWQETGFSASETSAFAEPYGISSYYHAGAIRTKSKMAKTQDIELSAFSIGDSIGFFCAPGELFDTISEEMEEASPFDMTLTVGFADGDWKYFPYGVCAEYDSYERHYGRFEAGTAEGMMTQWQDVLDEFYNNVVA